MDETAEDQSPRGSQQNLQGSQRTSPTGQILGPFNGEGSVSVQIPMALYDNLSHLGAKMECANVVDYVVQILRDEVDRAESDKRTTGYTQREIELIRRLLRDVECSD